MKHLKFVGIGLSIAFLATATFLMTRAKAGEATEPRPVAEPVSAPGWQLKDVDGKLVKSTDFAGKVVILDFWATWCGPCRLEIPGFIELKRQYAEKGLVVIGVSVDQDGAKAVKPFMAKMGINYPVVLGDEKIVSAFGGVEAIPTTFIIDRNGKIIRKHLGYTEKSEFEAEVKPLLKL